MSKNGSGGSKVLTAIIAFLLGFIFAILVEVGAIFGVYTFVTTRDINTIMSAIGLNNKDEDGNDKYINTDPDNGGVTNLKELIAGLQNLVYVNGEVVALGKSFDDFESLVPATKMVLNLVYNTVDGYIELDREEFESTPLSGLAQVLSNSVMGIKTGALLQKLNMDSVTGDDANAIVKSLLMGAETEYAAVAYASAAEESGEGAPSFKLPVLYDYYFYDEALSRYYREQPDRATPLPANLEGREDLLCETAMDEKDGEFTNKRFKLFYVPCRVSQNGISETEYSTGEYIYTDGAGGETRFTVLTFAEDTDFICVKPQEDGSYVLDHASVWAAYDESKADDYSNRFAGYSYDVNHAGNYYYAVKNESTEKYELKTICGKNYFRSNAGELIQLDALTVSDLISDTFGPLDSVPVHSVVGANSDIAYKVFGNTSLGELMRGEVDFNKLINDLEIGTIITNVAPDNKVMSYVVYKISDLTDNGDGTYGAVYDKFGENEQPVTVKVEGGCISEVRGLDGKLIEGVKVNQVAAMASDMPVTVLMDIAADDGIMRYLGYGVSGSVQALPDATDGHGNAYDYSGHVHIDGVAKPCYYTVNANDIIKDVWYYDGDTKVAVPSTTVSTIGDRLENFTDDLTIRDVLILEESDRFLNAIADTPISQLGSAIKDVTVDNLFEPDQIEKNALLRELRGTKLGELDTAIDSLLIQSIYAEEVYGLPADTGLMEVVDFDPTYKYYVINTDTDSGTAVNTFVLANGDGTLTQEQFDARGNTVYYTKGAEEGTDGAKMKIVGFDESWLYYEEDAANEGKHVLTEKQVTAGMTESERDNAIGHLTEEQYLATDDNGNRTKYYSYGFAKGMWNLVLFKNEAEKAYTMNNFNNMVNSCADNVNKATFFTLQRAGIIASNVNLEKTFNGTKLGDWKLGELILAISQMPNS